MPLALRVPGFPFRPVDDETHAAAWLAIHAEAVDSLSQKLDSSGSPFAMSEDEAALVWPGGHGEPVYFGFSSKGVSRVLKASCLSLPLAERLKFYPSGPTDVLRWGERSITVDGYGTPMSIAADALSEDPLDGTPSRALRLALDFLCRLDCFPARMFRLPVREAVRLASALPGWDDGEAYFPPAWHVSQVRVAPNLGLHPVAGFRAWTVEGGKMLSVSRDFGWDAPGWTVESGGAFSGGRLRRHRGFYAYHFPDDAINLAFGVSPRKRRGLAPTGAPSLVACGAILAAGHVDVGQAGFRASAARPVALLAPADWVDALRDAGRPHHFWSATYGSAAREARGQLDEAAAAAGRLYGVPVLRRGDFEPYVMERAEKAVFLEGTGVLGRGAEGA